MSLVSSEYPQYMFFVEKKNYLPETPLTQSHDVQ